MHFIKSVDHPFLKISIYSWNNKYIAKFEWMQLEQSFKLDSYEVANIEEFEAKLSPSFLDNVVQRFQQMEADWFD